MHSRESAMGVYVSPSWNPSHLPPQPIPQGRHSAPALRALSHASNLDFDQFHICWYTRFSSILSNHPALTIFNRVQKSVFHICVSFVASHVVIIIIFLNPIYMCVCVFIKYWCFFFLTYVTVFNRLQFHSPHLPWLKCIIFHSRVIFLCVYVRQLSYQLVYRWATRFLPCPSYCKRCCVEHWGTCESFNSGFLAVYSQQWDCWFVWWFYFPIFKESPHHTP